MLLYESLISHVSSPISQVTNVLDPRQAGSNCVRISLQLTNKRVCMHVFVRVCKE